MDDLKLKINESDNKLNIVFKEKNERAYELYNQLFNNITLYDLLTKEPEAIKKFNLADKEIKESLIREEEYIHKNGTDLEKNHFNY